MDVQAIHEALTAGGVRHHVRPGAKLTTDVVFMRKSLLLGLDEEVAVERLAAEIGCTPEELMRAASCGRVANCIVIDDLVIEGKEVSFIPREMDFIALDREHTGADRDGDILDPVGIMKPSLMAPLKLSADQLAAITAKVQFDYGKVPSKLTDEDKEKIRADIRSRYKLFPDRAPRNFGADGIVYTQDKQPVDLAFPPGTLEALKPVVVNRGDGWADVTLRFRVRAEVSMKGLPANPEAVRGVFSGPNGPTAPKEDGQ